MPVDIVKSRQLISAARARSQFPGGEIMNFMADQLQIAIENFSTEDANLRSLNATIKNLEQQLKTEREFGVSTQRRNQQLEQLVEPMRQIAKGEKGQKALATQALSSAEIPLVEPAAPVEIETT